MIMWEWKLGDIDLMNGVDESCLLMPLHLWMFLGDRSYAYDEFKLKREVTNIFNTAKEMLDAAEHILTVP